MSIPAEAATIRAAPTFAPTQAPTHALAWTLVFVAGLTLIRVVGLFLSPVQLYPEEAQYWVWSRHLAFGYFSKPPVIAWLIAATTAVGGNGEAWVRLSAPLVHAGAALALQRAGARLYGGWAGFWAAALYSLAPGVQLSSAVIATDAPMLLFVSLAVWSYAGLLTATRRAQALAWAAGLGVSLGLGALSKYAALYTLAGLVLHAVVDPDVRRRWRGGALALAIGLLLLTLAPNLAWNMAHGFETVAHTAADADWGEDAGAAAGRAHAVRHFDPSRATGFLLDQFAVFGPIPFTALIAAAAATLRSGRRCRDEAGQAMRRADVLLLSLAAPPLVIVFVQALITRANANWAAAAYAPGAILVAGWLARARAPGTARTRGTPATLGAALGVLWVSVASEALLGAVFFAAAVSPALADRLHLANSFKRARGWAQSAALVSSQLRAAAPTRGVAASGVSAVAVDDRFLFNALAYYDRALFAAPGAPPLRMWVREAQPHNEAETAAPLTAAPLTAAQGARVLFVDVVARYRREAQADFATVAPVATWTIPLDARHTRRLYVFVGQGFHRQPRDPITGLPAIDAVPGR